MSDKLLRATEASSMLGIHVVYLYRLAKEGSIPFVRLGGRSIRFPEAALQAWIAGRTERRTAKADGAAK